METNKINCNTEKINFDHIIGCCDGKENNTSKIINIILECIKQKQKQKWEIFVKS